MKHKWFWDWLARIDWVETALLVSIVAVLAVATIVIFSGPPLDSAADNTSEHRMTLSCVEMGE